MKRIFTALFLLVILSQTAFSQVDDRISQFGETNISGFVQPVATSLGTALNTGIYYTADYPTLFGFSISFRGMMISIPDADRTFNPQLPDGSTASDPSSTIFGPKDGGGVYSTPAGYITYPGGLDVTSLPMAFPQISATVMGTEVMVRFLPSIDINGDKLSFWGIGVSHSISRYIPLLPVDIAAQIVYSKISYGDIINVSNFAINAHASKTFGLFTAYSGLQYENTNLDLSYTLKGDPSSGDPTLRKDRPISASLTGDNHIRFTLGGSVKLGFLVINADYGIGAQSVLSGGLSFVF